MESSDWYIAGIGAIGTIIAANLCRGNEAVNLILKNEEALSLYNNCGLRVTTGPVSFTCYPPALTRSAINTPIHRLICCTKANDVTKLLLSLRERLTAESIIILIHNGMGVLDEIKVQLPELRIISGITTLGGYLEYPYSVQAFLKGNTILGETQGHYSENEIQLIKDTFRRCKLNVEWVGYIYDFIWDKFSINCSINLLTALFSCKNGELLTRNDLLKNLTQEIALILNAHAKEVTAEDLLSNVLTVIKNTAGNYSSMHQDIKKNRLSEIHYLNAYLLQLAEQKKIEVPLTKNLLTRFYQEFPNQNTVQNTLIS